MATVARLRNLACILIAPRQRCRHKGFSYIIIIYMALPTKQRIIFEVNMTKVIRNFLLFGDIFLDVMEVRLLFFVT